MALGVRIVLAHFPMRYLFPRNIVGEYRKGGIEHTNQTRDTNTLVNFMEHDILNPRCSSTTQRGLPSVTRGEIVHSPVCYCLIYTPSSHLV